MASDVGPGHNDRKEMIPKHMRHRMAKLVDCKFRCGTNTYSPSEICAACEILGPASHRKQQREFRQK